MLNLAADRSGGSPSFLLDLPAAAAGGHLELPDGVGAATMARVDALDPRDGVVVRRAAEGRADYELAVTIDVLDSLGMAAQEMLRDRDEIMERLKIERLPASAGCTLGPAPRILVRGWAPNPAGMRALPIAGFPPKLPASANSRSRPNATAPRHIRGGPGRGP